MRWISLILPIVLLTGELSAAAQAPPGKSWMEAVKDATVAIGTVRKASVQAPAGRVERDIFAIVGTGVIMLAPGQTKGPPWLVTAKHILYNREMQWDPDSIQIRFNWFDHKPVDEYLGITIRLKEKGRRLWTAHKDPSVDLAAIPLDISIAEAGRATAGPVPVQAYASADDMFEGASVFVFGYPGAVGPSYWTKAVVRTGIVAWTDPERPLASPFLIDSAIYPGNSGGPVFKVPAGIDRRGNLSLGGQVAFLGIISQGRTAVNPLRAAGRQVELQGPAGPTAVLSEQWVGIGVVEPAERVRELLEQVYGGGKAAK